VIANGDVADGASALKCPKWTNADGLMVGRATLGDPWVFADIKAAQRGQDFTRPVLAKRVDMAVRQSELALQDKGEHIACLEARKHFAWYLRGVAHSNFYKAQISAIGSMEDVYRIAKGIQNDLQ
jgi:tRNA-dihydrouridine synthase B